MVAVYHIVYLGSLVVEIQMTTSNPTHNDAAVRILTERAILTREVCQELHDVNGKFADRRPLVALSFLLHWIVRNLPDSFRVEPRPSDGIDRMVVPDGCQDLLQEIQYGHLRGQSPNGLS